ncbi:MAG: response regulator [Phototrophicaceae bacterium]
MFKIVILEDDLILLELYRDVLTLADYEPLTISSLDSIQAYFETDTADLIIADLRLDATSAEKTLEVLQKIRLQHPIKVILVSAQMMIYEANCRQAGFTHLLTKPFPNSVLVQMVQQVLHDDES